ncbi:hypothetical protein HAZT_HAZT009957 [Hyalella azteca]|uniref:AH domain-containing protein n=1 Tax=Hyalella azteca TaxID=294128 RepID=A0A6A0HAC0_HYAAZ|nr:hypothetical protein HAZT_HAZT009957 [Hyalella azteca]
MQDVCAYLAELSLLWTQFELILEGERHVDQSRELYSIREQREIKCRKELAKCSIKGAEEVKLYEERVVQAEKGKDLAYLEVVDRIKENETVKLIRFREGLRKISAAYVTLGQHCQAVFSAYNSVACTLPDVHNKDLQDIRYTGNREAAAFVQRAKEQVLGHSFDRDAAAAPSSAESEKLRVNMPDEGRPDLPPKRNPGKQSESQTCLGGTHNSSSARHHDPPPSYSAVMEQDSAAVEGACGITRNVRSNVVPSSDDLGFPDQPIQISYPSYLNSRSRTSYPSFIPPASAPVSSHSSAPVQDNNTVDTSHTHRALARSVSDRRSLATTRSYVHPILRRQESDSARPSSTHEDYPLTRNETQMGSVGLRKTQKKLSLRSISYAAGNTITGLLGLNTKTNARYEPGIATDSDDYESYNFSSGLESSSHPSDDNYRRTNHGDVHGILTQDLDRDNGHAERNSNSQTERDKNTHFRRSGDTKCINESQEKSRALSAKFGLKIPISEMCREELEEHDCNGDSLSSLRTNTVVRPVEDPSQVSGRTLQSGNSKKKKSRANNKNSGENLSSEKFEISSESTASSLENIGRSLYLDKENQSKRRAKTVGSDTVNSAPQSLPGAKKSHSSPTINLDLNPKLPVASRVADDPCTIAPSGGKLADLDGDLASLAKARPPKNTNPFYNMPNSDEILNVGASTVNH